MADSISIPQTLALALQHHQSGRWDEAERLCRKVLEADPGQSDGWHLLGVVVCAAGRIAEGIGQIQKAIALQPGNPSFRTNLGVILYKQQRFPEAEACYRESISLQPTQPDVHGYLGNALLAQKKWREAEESYLAALKLNPRQPAVWCNLGSARQSLNLWEEAESSLREAIRLKPAMASAHCNLGSLFQKQGRYPEAEQSFREAIGHDPNFVEGHNNLGLVLARQGRTEEAIAHFRKAIQVGPGSVNAYCNLSNALRVQEKTGEAEAVCRQALQINPQFAEAWHALGIALQDQGRLGEAEAAYRQAIELKPGLAESHANLGAVLEKLDRLEEGEASCRNSIELNPGSSGAHHNLASILKSQGQLQEAELASRKAIELEPDYAEAHNMLRGILWDQGRRDEARESALAALEIQPGHVNAHLGLAMDCLVRGDFEMGWPEYEWRWKCEDAGAPLPVDVRAAKPLWDGSPLEGKTLLLYTEQGIGDIIQFSRYVPLVRNMVRGKLRFACHILCGIPLLRMVDGIGEVISGQAPLPDFDEQISLMSVPGVLKTRLETIPAARSYLRIDESWRELVRPRLGAKKGFRVGINWQGNPKNRNDRFRSMPLSEWRGLSRVGGIEWFSLQYGAGREQLGDFAGFAIIDLGRTLDQIAEEEPGETAANRLLLAGAAIGEMDLVITVDTMTAHLAGALGKPVWVLLSPGADWRWFLEREDSPWYPSLRLFRQASGCGWDEVLERIADELLLLSSSGA